MANHSYMTITGKTSGYSFLGEDIWDLNNCANKLINQSCTLGARHLKGPTIRLQLSREVANLAKKILLQAEEGEKDLKQGLDVLLKEYEYLTRQGKYTIDG